MIIRYLPLHYFLIPTYNDSFSHIQNPQVQNIALIAEEKELIAITEH